MDGAPPPEEDFTTIALPERSVHKNWKARLSAYTDLTSKFGLTTSDEDPFFRIYLSDPDLLKKWATDSNVVAQEKGVEALSTLVRESGENSARLRADIFPSVIDKCFGSARASMKMKAIELALVWIEVENTGEGVVMDVLKGLEAKQPKIVQTSVNCLKEIVTAYGIKTLGNPKPLLKSLTKIFGHTDKIVRSEGTLLTQQLYLFLGATLTPFLQELKPIQIQELTDSFNSLAPGGSGIPSRLTRRQQREQQTKEMDSANGAGGDDGEEDGGDDLGLVPDKPPPVDALAKLPSDFHEAIASTKWKDRLETCQTFLHVLKTNSTIEDGNFESVVAALGKRMADANINVVIAAANVIEALATGLEKNFAKYKAAVMTPIMERLKERKATVADALGNALYAISTTVSLPDITEDVVTALKSKNPQVKEGTLKFFCRVLKETRESPSKNDIKPLCDSIVPCTGDSLEPVRAAAAEALGLMMKILGERAFGPVLETLDDSRKTKVKEAFEKAQIKFKVGGMPAKGSGTKSGGSTGPAAAPAPIKKPVAARPKPAVASKATANPAEDESRPPPAPVDRSSGFGGEFPESNPNGFGSEDPPPPPRTAPIRKPPARLLAAKKPAVGAASTSAPSAVRKLPASSSSSTKPKPGPASASASEPLRYKYSSEEAEAKWEVMIPGEMRDQLADANWKARLEGTEKMTAWLENGEAEVVESEIMFRFFSKIPGWNEKNFQVSSKIYGMMALLASKSSSFSKACVAICVGHLTDKLGDIKLKKPAGEALVAFAEKLSLGFVLEQAFEPMTKAKSPKTQADAIAWVNSTLTDFGIAGIALRDLIEFLKNGLKSSNAAVRAAATKAIVTVKIFVGSTVSTFLDDLNPQLLTTINNEFAKVEGQTAPEPTRFSAGLVEASSSQGKGGGGGGGDPLDQLVPRADLDKLISGTSIIADLKNANWKSRKEGAETLLGILQANTRLKPGMGEIGSMLKGRLTDTNIMVKLLSLDCIGRIAKGMGKPFEKFAKMFVVPVCAILADQKVSTRGAAANTLTDISTASGGLDGLMSSFATSMENPNPLLRSTLLAWLTTWFQEHGTASSDITPLTSPLIACLEDRSPDVRKTAAALLPIVIGAVGYEYAMEQVSSLKPAMRQTVIPLIQAARGSASAPAPTTTTASAPSKVATTAAKPASSTASVASSLPPSRPTSSTSTSTAKPAVATGPSSRPKSLMGAMPKTSTIPTSSRPASRAVSVSSNDDYGTSKIKPGLGLKRPGVSSSRTVSSSTSASLSSGTSASPPFRTSDPGAKANRAKKDAARWVFHEKAEVYHTDLLATQMEPHASPSLYTLLFSRDHNASVDFLSGMAIIIACFQSMAGEAERMGIDEESLRNSLICNLDLILKYAAIRMHDSNTQSITRAIDLVEQMIDDFSSGPDTSVRHSFDEYELQLVLPTMISKLGDSKFQSKIQDLFKGKMRYVVPASRLYQILVAQGLPLKNAKARVEVLKAMTNIIKQIGTGDTLNKESIAAVVKCLSDSDGKIRNGALDVLGETYKTAGEGIYDLVKVNPKERDLMDARFKHVQGPVPVASKALSARLAQESTARSSSPAINRISRLPLAQAESPRTDLPSVLSPPRISSPRPLASLAATPGKGIPGPSRFGARPASAIHPPPSPLPALRPPSRTTQPAAQIDDEFSPSSSSSYAPPPQPSFPTTSVRAPTRMKLNGLTSGQSLRPSAPETVQSPYSEDTSDVIRSILANDPRKSVEGLKKVQKLFESPSEAFVGSVDELLSAIIKQSKVVFDTPDRLLDPAWFRVSKHLIQAINFFCDRPALLKELDNDLAEDLLHELTARLLQTDDSTGDVRELSRHLNMIILRIFNGARREVVFHALFVLLRKVTIRFPEDHISATSRTAKHAELILKCIWKRARSVEEDLENGLVDPVILLRIIEEFLQQMPPAEWRRRAQGNIPMGDMPLRTVKVVLQHVVSKYGGERVYDQLSAAFDEPEETHSYTYIFRLVNQTTQPPPSSSSGSMSQSDPKSRTESPRLSVSDGRPESVASTNSSTIDRSIAPPTKEQVKPPSSPVKDSDVEIRDEIEQEMKDIVQAVVRGDSLQRRMEELSQILIRKPEKKGKFEELISHIDVALQMFLKRAVANRMRSESESPTAIKTSDPNPAGSPTQARSPPPPTSPVSGQPQFSSRPSNTGMSRPISTLGLNGYPRSATILSTEEDPQLARYKQMFGYSVPSSSSLSSATSSGNLPDEP
ncbi:Microtubule-associated protein [Phaffia rhodozyma]|uniref:Microtubule-associated protein n=1 Tax=Phaffia rhodozyma TaxID=264483 RepID=A0A0F7SUI0_PHARH|nr:Microtubule-associated protein [Phaffia rhodozyma]